VQAIKLLVMKFLARLYSFLCLKLHFLSEWVLNFPF